MGWTLPTTRSIGDLITAAIWNTDLKDNLILLKTSINDDGTLHGCARLLDKSTTAQDVTNTVTETSVYSYSVPGNTLGTSNGLRLVLTGLSHVDTSSATVTVRVKFGGTTFATAVLNLTATHNGGYKIEVLLNANGATNSQRAVVVSQFFNLGASETVAVLTQGSSTVGIAYHDALTVDTTTAQTLTVTVQWSSALSTNHFRRWSATTELLAA
jgi:hypothetical protein